MLRRANETREHTTSYYAATRDKRVHFKALHGTIDADICVVGGGFTGVNTALELSERGYKVVLAEANRIGWGASGRNGGQIIGGVGNNPQQFRSQIGEFGVEIIRRAGFECCEIIRERVARYNINCDLRWGYADVAIKPRQLRALEQWQQQLQSIGYQHSTELVDQATMKSNWVNSDRYIGGLINPTGYGHLHPLNLCLGEAQAAQSLGTRIFEQTRITGFKDHGGGVNIITEHGSINSKYLVLAGNAYLGDLQPNLAKRILPAASCIIATAPLGSQASELLPENSAVCDQRTALDYFRLSADGRLLFGGLSNYTGLVPSNLVKKMRQKMQHVFPTLKNTPIEFGWSGNMGIGINRMPQLGKLSENVFYIQAYSGHGVAPSHATARITAEAIDMQLTRFDVFQRIKHWNWPGGTLLRRPGMALGMMWYKLLDEL